jgi:starvation-inducible DNA-binding protein
MATATRETTRMFDTGVSLKAGVREDMIALLNQQLATTLDLYSQTKQAHWNVKGPQFYQLHLLFDEQAAHASAWVDLLAERAVMLGGYATGTVRMSAEATALPEFPTDITAGMDYVAALVERWSTYANAIREAIDTADEAGDASTADLLTEISRQADMDLWFQQAHLQDR